MLSGRKAPRVSRPGPYGQEEVKGPMRPLSGRPLSSETRRGLIATKKFPSVQFHPVLCLSEQRTKCWVPTFSLSAHRVMTQWEDSPAGSQPLSGTQLLDLPAVILNSVCHKT